MSRLDAIKARAKVVATKPENREATYAEFGAVLHLACFDVPALVSAVEVVLALHKEVSWRESWSTCIECNDGQGQPLAYPCETVAAIMAALDGDQ